jgi:hypothetical protein
VNAAVFRCPADAKISFALVQPWKQISGAVKLRKLDLVRRLKKLSSAWNKAGEGTCKAYNQDYKKIDDPNARFHLLIYYSGRQQS